MKDYKGANSILSLTDIVWGAIFAIIASYYGVDLLAKFGLFDEAKTSLIDLSEWAMHDFRILTFVAVCLCTAAISSTIRHKRIAARAAQERNDRMSRQYR